MVINEILGEIHKAEEQAEKIIADAHKEAARIEQQNQLAMEILREESNKSVNAQIKQAAKALEEQFVDTDFGNLLSVPKAKQDAARKYIVKAFHEKFISGRLS